MVLKKKVACQITNLLPKLQWNAQKEISCMMSDDVETAAFSQGDEVS